VARAHDRGYVRSGVVSISVEPSLGRRRPDYSRCRVHDVLVEGTGLSRFAMARTADGLLIPVTCWPSDTLWLSSTAAWSHGARSRRRSPSRAAAYVKGTISGVGTGATAVTLSAMSRSPAGRENRHVDLRLRPFPFGTVAEPRTDALSLDLLCGSVVTLDYSASPDVTTPTESACPGRRRPALTIRGHWISYAELSRCGAAPVDDDF